MDECDLYLLLSDYKLDNTIPKYVPRNKKRIEEHSRFCWAVDELGIYIFSHTDIEPVDACMKFIRQMSYYRWRYPKMRQSCDTAIEVAYDIMDILMCAKEVYYEQV